VQTRQHSDIVIHITGVLPTLHYKVQIRTTPLSKKSQVPISWAPDKLKLRVILTLCSHHLLTGHRRRYHQWLRCAQPCVCSVLQSAHGAAQRTGAAGSVSAGDPANPRGGEQNLGDIDIVRCWPQREWKGKRERGQKKNLGSAIWRCQCQIQTANNLSGASAWLPAVRLAFLVIRNLALGKKKIFYRIKFVVYV
jgi:hypothetical protein